MVLLQRLHFLTQTTKKYMKAPTNDINMTQQLGCETSQNVAVQCRILANLAKVNAVVLKHDV
jgi:hypothetical protein